MRTRLPALLVTVALLAALAPASAFGVEPDDLFPGLPIPASPVAGSLSSTDRDDIFSIGLAAGDELTLSLRGDAGSELSLALFNEGIGTEEWESLFWFWQSGYPKETSYVVPEGQEATYSVDVHSMDPSATAAGYSLTWSKRHEKVARIYGPDRYQTAVAVSRSSFVEATTAVIACGDNYPDALAAAGLAGVLRAPVLLTRRDAMPDAVWRELQRLQVTGVKVIGSDSVVSDALVAQLAATPSAGGPGLLDVERIWGRTRFETARRVAERVRQLGGSSEAFLVSGRNYADALSVSPIAYARKMPVVLTEPRIFSAEAAAALDSLDSTHVVIAGSPFAVGASVASGANAVLAANDAGGGHLLERWEGANRFATSLDVAKHAVDLGWASWDQIGLSTGWNFPDALGGGAALGERGGVLLLSDPLVLTAATRAELQARKGSIERAYLFGSAYALSEGVRSAAQAALE